MKQVKLTKGYFALVDDEDYFSVSNHHWCCIMGGGASKKPYAQANVKIDGKWTRMLMHRFILSAKKNTKIDHKDNNGLNNQRENLRLATSGQNQHNTTVRKGKYKGVCWNKRAGKWLVQIMANRKHYYLGLFEDEVEAAKAYDKAAKLHHGEFARTNFTDETPRAEAFREAAAMIRGFTEERL